MAGLWKNDPKTKGGKFLVLRRDGTVPDWPYMVLGARDPAAPAALRAYADECERLEFDPIYVVDVRRFAEEFEEYRKTAGNGDPDAPRHRQDLPLVTAVMRERSRGA